MLTTNFTLDEALFSQTAIRNEINNTPTPEHLENIKLTALCMELVRTALGNVPIHISSWYRTPQVNALVRGSRNSAHMSGEAVDFIAPKFGSPYEICLRLSQPSIKSSLQYDQLIFEGTWVHIGFISIPTPTRNPRGQELTWMLDRSYREGFIESRKLGNERSTADVSRNKNSQIGRSNERSSSTITGSTTRFTQKH